MESLENIVFFCFLSAILRYLFFHSQNSIFFMSFVALSSRQAFGIVLTSVGSTRYGISTNWPDTLHSLFPVKPSEAAETMVCARVCVCVCP